MLVVSVISIFGMLSNERSYAEEPKLTNFVIDTNRDELFIYMELEGFFTEDIVKAIWSGVPTTFSVVISLYKVRQLFRDYHIKDLIATHTIKYDDLKKEFSVTRSWDKFGAVVTQSFPEAQHLMCKIERLPIIALSDLTKESQYQLRTKAEMTEITLPFYLHYVFFFVSLWNVETNWFYVDFIWP